MSGEASGVPAPGEVLGGKFLVEGVLGQGGMGVVVAARHLQLDQRVALKFLLPEALAHAELVARFAREARAAAKIKGEHVARVLDVGELPNGSPYMVMELLEGEDLSRVVERGPAPASLAARWLLEACEALAEAHAAGIVHRDLKPQNLFVARQPGGRTIVKVLDFGISKMVDPSGVALTSTSNLMGTAYYMSPEQLSSPKSVDARADVWALGVILYELVTGRLPFPGETVPEEVAGILRNAPPPPQSVVPEVPDEACAIIRRCMTADVATRYPDVAALASDLAPLAPDWDRAHLAAMRSLLGPAALVETAPGGRTSAAPDPMQKTQLAGTVAAGVAVPAGTAHAMSTSHPLVEPAPKKAKSAMPMLAGVAVVALAIGGGAAYALRSPTSGPGAGTSAPTSTAPTASATATTSATATATASTSASAPVASATAPPVSASAIATAPTATPTTRPTTTARPTSTAAASAAPTTTHAATTAAPSSSRGTLHMELK